MAVAAASPPETKNSTPSTPLWMASLVGAVFVIAALGVVFYGVPKLWEMTVATSLKNSLGGLFNGALLLGAQVVAAIVLIIVGSRIAGEPAVPGIRGGITLAISTIFTVFFFARAVAMIGQNLFGLTDGVTLGVFIGALGGFGLIGVRFLRGRRFARWANGWEDAGWFSTFSHKRTQGRTVRRLTMIGLLVIFGAGIQTMIQNQHFIGMSDWDVELPFIPLDKLDSNGQPVKALDTNKQPIKAADGVTDLIEKKPARVVLLPDAQFTIPLVLIFLALWFSWRAINYPPFADFLVATEAEMNKVSWTPRKALIRDTIVVLSTVFVITAFIFVVDIFWGWLLSRELVGVLPRSTTYYHLEIKKIPEDKRDKIAEILRSDAVGYKEDDAKKIVETVPPEETKGKTVIVKSKQQRDVKRTGFDDDLSARLQKRMQDEGAVVDRVLAKEETKNVW